MRAVLIREPGDPDVLTLGQAPAPEPGPGQVLVRVRAAGINRGDIMQRRGKYPAPEGWPQDIPGLEYAGEVSALGAGARRWRAGDRVMGLVGGGGYAEYVAVHEDEAVAVPAGLSWEEAAAIPEAFITAHDALFTRLALQPEERLLVHAVGSGVGTAALQLARDAGAHVMGTSRSAWKLERAAELAPLEGVDTSTEDFVARALAWTGERGVDAVLELVGGDYVPRNVKALAVLGRLALVGLVAGARAELDLRAFMSRRLTLVGTVLRSRPLEQKIAAARAFAEHVEGRFEDGRLRPVVDRVFAMEEAPAAHRHVEEGQNFGKVVLRWA